MDSSPRPPHTSNEPGRFHVSRRGIIEMAASFGLLAAVAKAPAAEAAVAVRQGVVGAWSLVSFDVDEGKGAEKPRFGPDPVGYLIYSADARMAAVLGGHASAEARLAVGQCRRRRTRGRNRCATSSPTPDDTKCAATACSTTWRFRCLPTSMGVTLERQFKVEGDTLTIRTVPPEIWGTSNVLVWKRA